MNSIDSFPPADYPLMEKLPVFKAETRHRLFQWGNAQKEASHNNRTWLVERALAYARKFYPGKTDTAAFNEFAKGVEASAALDLLRWRIGAKDNREAVQHLNLPLEKASKDLNDENDQTQKT